MKRQASLGVLIPTRNSASLLPDHLAALTRWLDLADEIIVIDSDSTDGTKEIVHQRLAHLNWQWHSHPPGLYQSWNAGLSRLTTTHAYIATVGDTITREGIEALLDCALSQKSDVVISKPAFRKPNGELVSVRWPIDDMVESLQIEKPRLMDPIEMLAFAAVHASQALTGSCASNLFRTDLLHKVPFPTEFGTAGDGIWSLRQAGRCRWSVLPGTFSTFLLHPTAASQSENRPRPGIARADAILAAAVQGWLAEGAMTQAELQLARWDEFQSALTGYMDAKEEFDRLRKARWPWSLRPHAWAVRNQRSACARRLHTLKQQALQAAAARTSGSTVKAGSEPKVSSGVYSRS